jgi:hypothetical protein
MLGALSLPGGCRSLLGPDNARPPAEDAADAAETAETGAAPGAPLLECDLLLQDCVDHRACFPDEKLLGNTHCELKSGGALQSTCTMQADCDTHLICVIVPTLDPNLGVCTQLCRIGGDTSGCDVGMMCAALAQYPGVGYCIF